MHKTLALGVLFVFALSGQAQSGNQSLISTSDTETISAAGTLQVTSVSPKTEVPKTPAAAKAPQLNPTLVALRNMQDAASQMLHQFDRYQREKAKFQQDPTMMKDSAIRSELQAIQAPESGAYRGTTDLLQDLEGLKNLVNRVLEANKTK